MTILLLAWYLLIGPTSLLFNESKVLDHLRLDTDALSLVEFTYNIKIRFHCILTSVLTSSNYSTFISAKQSWVEHERKVFNDEDICQTRAKRTAFAPRNIRSKRCMVCTCHTYRNRRLLDLLSNSCKACSPYTKTSYFNMKIYQL